MCVCMMYTVLWLDQQIVIFFLFALQFHFTDEVDYFDQCHLKLKSMWKEKKRNIFYVREIFLG
jgi:hypothetical protein